MEVTGGIINEYEDIYHGESYLEAVAHGDISEDDMVLVPDLQYKKRYVLVGGIIPGPKNPKNTDSYLFPGFYHLAAIQKQGLCVWDGKDAWKFTSW